MIYIAVFFGMTLLDFVYAEYTKAAADRHVHTSSTYATCLIVITGLVTSEYVNDRSLLIPAAAGAYVGTYISMRFPINLSNILKLKSR